MLTFPEIESAICFSRHALSFWLKGLLSFMRKGIVPSTSFMSSLPPRFGGRHRRFASAYQADGLSIEPRLQTDWTFNVSVMVVVGSPWTSNKSALAPGTIRPRSVSPNRRAGIEVADLSASKGVRPAATRSWSS